MCVLTISFFAKWKKIPKSKEHSFHEKRNLREWIKSTTVDFKNVQGSTNSLPTPMKCKNCIFRGVHNLSAKKALKLNFFCLFFAFFKKVSKLHVWQKKRGKKIVTNLKSSRMKTASMFAVHIFAIIGLCLSSGLGYKYSNKEEPLRGIHSSEISMIFCLLGFT